AEQMTEVIGKDKVEDFAKNLGVNVADASSGLSEMLPQLIDMSSRGGKLLESLGGSSGLAGLASKFLK
ncbi:MAG: YidB family protein, partial [Pseudomonadota bacterium]